MNLPDDHESPLSRILSACSDEEMSSAYHEWFEKRIKRVHPRHYAYIEYPWGMRTPLYTLPFMQSFNPN